MQNVVLLEELKQAKEKEKEQLIEDLNEDRMSVESKEEEQLNQEEEYEEEADEEDKDNPEGFNLCFIEKNQKEIEQRLKVALRIQVQHCSF